MRWRLLVLFLATWVVCGCASNDWHWTDPGVHLVDGAWLTDEISCSMDSSGQCGLAVRAARDWVQAQDRAIQVVGGRWADLPRDWVDATGRAHSLANGALFAPSVGVLTLASGEIRLVALECRGDTTDSQGHVAAAMCSAQGEMWAQFLVGASPPPVVGD